MVNETSGAVAAASGMGTAWAFATQATDVVFGLPIQVVLACFFASAGARSYVGPIGFWKAAWVITMCAALGAYTVPLALHLFGLPTAAQAGVGVLLSGGMQLPAVREWFVNMVKAVWQLRAGVSVPAAATPPTAPAVDKSKDVK